MFSTCKQAIAHQKLISSEAKLRNRQSVCGLPWPTPLLLWLVPSGHTRESGWCPKGWVCPPHSQYEQGGSREALADSLQTLTEQKHKGLLNLKMTQCIQLIHEPYYLNTIDVGFAVKGDQVLQAHVSLLPSLVPLKP